MGIIDIRDLHKAIGLYKFFADWWSVVITRHKFIEGKDYFVIGIDPIVKNGRQKIIWIPIRTAIIILEWYKEKRNIIVDVTKLIKYEGLFQL